MTDTNSRRLAIVTGGASGIGLATTTILLREGWSVCIFDRDAKTIALARESLAPFGVRVAVEAADVTDEAAIEKLVAESARRMGPVGGTGRPN